MQAVVRTNRLSYTDTELFSSETEQFGQRDDCQETEDKHLFTGISLKLLMGSYGRRTTTGCFSSTVKCRIQEIGMQMRRTLSQDALTVALNDCFQVGSWDNFFSGVMRAVPHRLNPPAVKLAPRRGTLPPAGPAIAERLAGQVAARPELLIPSSSTLWGDLRVAPVLRFAFSMSALEFVNEVAVAIVGASLDPWDDARAGETM